MSEKISGNWKLFKCYENWFLFDLKSSFCSEKYSKIFLTFLVIYENGLIRKLEYILKFMTSQPRKQTNKILLLSKLSGTKGNQSKFGQLIKYNMSYQIFCVKLYSALVILSKRYS